MRHEQYAMHQLAIDERLPIVGNDGSQPSPQDMKDFMREVWLSPERAHFAIHDESSWFFSRMAGLLFTVGAELHIEQARKCGTSWPYEPTVEVDSNGVTLSLNKEGPELKTVLLDGANAPYPAELPPTFIDQFHSRSSFLIAILEQKQIEGEQLPCYS